MSMNLFVKDERVCSEIVNRIPSNIKHLITIYDVNSVKGLEMATLLGVFGFPTLITSGERYTSVNEILDVIERMAVEMGDEPPFKR